MNLHNSAVVRIACILSLALTVYRGVQAQKPLLVPAPDALAGRWEAPQRYGAVGIDIDLTTHMEGAVTSLAGHAQYLDDLEVGVYERTEREVGPLNSNFFSMKLGGGAMMWDGRRLTIHLDGGHDLPRINLNLLWHEDSRTWSGLFERGKFKEQVVLIRPQSTVIQSAFVGTWMDEDPKKPGCLHLAQGWEGGLTGWTDGFRTPGLERFANGIEPPKQSIQHYGGRTRVEASSSNQITIEAGSNVVCCSHRFIVKLSDDGQSLSGNWLAGPNQMASPVRWRRVEGESCINAVGAKDHKPDSLGTQKGLRVGPPALDSRLYQTWASP